MDQNARFLMSIVLRSLKNQGLVDHGGGRGTGGVDPAILLTAVLDMLAWGHLEEVLSAQTHRDVVGQVTTLPPCLLVGGGWRMLLKLLLTWADKEDGGWVGTN